MGLRLAFSWPSVPFLGSPEKVPLAIAPPLIGNLVQSSSQNLEKLFGTELAQHAISLSLRNLRLILYLGEGRLQSLF